MNKTYALVWNRARRCWTAVGETAHRRGKPGTGRRATAAAVSLLGLAALPAFALPSGEAVTSGKADIVRSGDGRTMNINQLTDKLITNWNDFSVAGGERVSFNQPNAVSVALNRVIGNQGSQIDGQISANGRVFLVNPNGVLFGAGAQVNVGGLVASTKDISDADFQAGRYRFSGNSTRSIVNHGTLTAADGGSIALLGARVSNHGVIQAKLGRVTLAAGDAFTVNFDGNGLLDVQVDGGAVNAEASNGGLLKADGGDVLMTARAAGNLLDAVVNNTGVVEARGLNGRGGRITLDGGTVKVAGHLDASAGEAGAPAGAVTTRGERVDIAAGTQVDTRGGNRAGTWTIEAANAGVNGANDSGRSIGADTLSRNLGTTSVDLTNTREHLRVGGPVAWTSDNALTLTSRNGDVVVDRTISADGANASLNVNAAKRIRINDAVSLTGRRAHLELNAKDGHTLSGDKAVITLSGNDATYRSNGEDYKVLHTLDDLRGIDANLNGRYVLGNAIDGNNANFRSIGGNAAFAGIFDGFGNTIARISVYNTSAHVGLFAANAGRIANLGLRNVAATASGLPGTVGTLAGYNTGTISNVVAQDIRVVSRGRSTAGGLVGENRGGTIEGARVSGRIDADRDASEVGGLAGANVTLAGRAGTIRDSSADTLITADGNGSVGGLVGRNAGLIEASSSAGGIVASSNSAVAGGLVGVNEFGGVVRGSSSAASVTARENAIAGGLVGFNLGTVRDSHATGAVNVGRYGIAGGFVGLNFGTIDASTASGDVVAGDSSDAGGFVGVNNADILASHAHGNVTAGDSGRTGGFAGTNDGTLDTVAASGDVRSGKSSQTGGLAGYNGARIHASTAHGTVRAGARSDIGGLAGFNGGDIDGSSADGAVVAGADSAVGGLVGLNWGKVSASRASGNVTAAGVNRAGGLVGDNNGTVRQSTASGHVTAADYAEAGGLVGRNTGNIDDSSATGNVLAGKGSNAGGLVGLNDGAIARSTATGNVAADTRSRVGGLVGQSLGSIVASRASGAAQGGDLSDVGGLVGRNHGTIKRSSSSGAVSALRQSALGGLVGANFGYVGQSSTSSRVVVMTNAGQHYGAIAGENEGQLVDNVATKRDASVPLVGARIVAARP
ncbi:filamentous hemagglutinin [Burkholderia lata]|uniref:Filamentous hemagglutinin n=1 Tax=Burkholderia lata (strain ATCC 17760 / DSM 23089 / LMG 22485 / NCIMB 9086 / R18194 / 383) TaxID=482957 RepID=A0A6P2YR89_BURL3|nr:GLUG motif-containing protein [Burkholderia lata]VWD21609.1 filamentous hemagglutinin [Burkholderia lata]